MNHLKYNADISFFTFTPWTESVCNLAIIMRYNDLSKNNKDITMSDVFYRSTLEIGSVFIGCYRYKDVFQILRSQKTSSNRDGFFMDIEYNDKYRMPHPEKDEYKNALGQGYGHLDFLKELISLINICTNQYCDIDLDKKNISRPSPQQQIESFTEINDYHPLRKSDTRILDRQNPCHSEVELQSQTGQFLDNYFGLDNKSRQRINASLFVYHAMRKLMFSSISMGVVGFISSIENLVDFDGKKKDFKAEKCNECGQLKFKVYSRFYKFMNEYSEVNFKKRHNIESYYHTAHDYKDINIKKFIKDIYSKRSNITHAGQLFEIDSIFSGFPMEEVRLFNEIACIVRIAIFSYILSYDVAGKTIVFAAQQ